MDCDKTLLTYMSTYQKDYVEKIIKLQRDKARRQEFSNPIAEGYRKYLSFDKPHVELPNEDGEKYLDKFKENRKRIGDLYYKDPIDKQVIFRNKITKGTVTEYQTNYCDIEKDIQYYLQRRTHKHFLSDDVELPQTTYAKYFRDPEILFGRRFEKLDMIRPRDSLKTQGKTTAFTIDYGSEYSGNIGRLGEIIVRENMVGQNLYDVMS